MVEIKRDAKRPGFLALCTDPEEELVVVQPSLVISNIPMDWLAPVNWEHSVAMHCFRTSVKMGGPFATTSKDQERDERWVVLFRGITVT